MWRYLLKRVLVIFPTLFGIALISFLFVTLAPGDPTALKLSSTGKTRGGGTDELTIRKNKELFGLDLPRVLNTAPATRATVVAGLLVDLDDRAEALREEAITRLGQDVGAAGLELALADLPRRVTAAAGERRRREDALAALEAALGPGAPGGGATRPEDLARALERLATDYPELAPPAQLLDGRVLEPAERARRWLAVRGVLLADAEAPARRLLRALALAAPPRTGGPALAEGAGLDVAARTWAAWWAERAAHFAPDRVAAAVEGWLERGVVPAPSPTGEGAGGEGAGGEGAGGEGAGGAGGALAPPASPELAALERVGTLAAPALMAALEAAEAGSERERRAAFGLATVCKKPWTLVLTPEEVGRLESEWRAKAAELDAEAAAEDPAAQARARAAARLREALGTVEAHVARERAKVAAEHRQRWADWWWRAEEQFVDFGSGRQAVRALTQTQFGRWLGRFVRLDFGESYKEKRPVWDMIRDRIGPTLTLNVLSLAIAYLIAVPLGIFSAVRKDTPLDRGLTVGLFVLYSLPSFWVGSMLILFFTGEGALGWFPAYHFQSLDADRMSTWEWLKDVAWHIALPVLCLTYAELAYLSRQMRTGLLDVIRQDYVRTARAKGLPERVVVLKHAVRNGMIPILTLMGSLLPVMFGGSVIIETIFTIEGLGKMAFDAISNRDYPVIMANLVIGGFLTLVGLLLSDLAYAIVDPRIELR